MNSQCPSCGTRISWRKFESDFACPNCGAKLHSTGPSLFGWIGWPLGPLAFMVAGDAPWWGQLLALTGAAAIAMAAAVVFGTVSLQSKRDAT